jgi:pseudouridine-5'-phosphate glycosidase
MNYLNFSKEVFLAIKHNLPIVALESTIISHGMPFPENMETGLLLEEVIRGTGAVPATIAILGGEIKIGLEKEELEHLARQGSRVVKTSRRDIPFVIAKGLDGATTVASTMIFAAMAGIRVFATGGIGGVHRNAETTMDISADLTELANTNVAVVSAGVKSILDIGLTLEYLETMGVPVVGYQTDEFPAFYTKESGFRVDYSVASAFEMAQALKMKWDLGLNGGIIIGNPIPDEYSYDKKEIDKAIHEALEESIAKGIKGKAVTPFLLAKIKELTKGKSLASNIALAKNNASVAAMIAVEYAKL